MQIRLKEAASLLATEAPPQKSAIGQRGDVNNGGFYSLRLSHFSSAVVLQRVPPSALLRDLLHRYRMRFARLRPLVLFSSQLSVLQAVAYFLH